ncbi:MAG TPA: type II toxin-antitoxin system VapC family toxin [Pilimelia sp.]|nr:type II toxin-antitoxin system VapC family toxin [Pilimelia sp.]
MTPMPRRVVLDASAAVALLADAGPAGRWADAATDGAALFATELMPFEVSNILRRHALTGALDPSAATLAHADLVALAVEFYPYAALADRVWRLRDNVTAYDASYVALAELLRRNAGHPRREAGSRAWGPLPRRCLSRVRRFGRYGDVQP